MTFPKEYFLGKLASCKYTPWWNPCGAVKEEENYHHMVDGLPPSTFMAELLFSSSRSLLFFYFFTYLIQRFGLVILRLKLEPVVINVALVFHVPTLDYDLSFLAADGVMSTLVMTKTASNVSMQTWNLCWNNAVKIHKKFTDYTSQRLFRNTDVWCV